MDIDNRILEIEQTFNTKQAERDEHIRLAEECLTDMHKLQGAYQALKDLQEAEKGTAEPSVQVEGEVVKSKKGK